MIESTINIIIVEDHNLQLDGLKMMLNRFSEFNVVATFNNPKQFLEKKNRLNFDIAIFDLHMPEVSGIELAEILHAEKHGAKVVLLTMQRGTRFMQKAEKAGVKGYLLKSISIEKLKAALLKINSGEIIVDETLRDYSQDDDIHIKSTLTVDDYPDQLLSEREKEILIMVCKEYSSSQIAEKLFISTGTVDTHRKNILIKLGVSNTVGLVKYALKHGLLKD